jgi:hypothetical protein
VAVLLGHLSLQTLDVANYIPLEVVDRLVIVLSEEEQYLFLLDQQIESHFVGLLRNVRKRVLEEGELFVEFAFLEVEPDLLQYFSGEIVDEFLVERILLLDGFDVEDAPNVFVDVLFQEFVLHFVGDFAKETVQIVGVQIVTNNPIRFYAE